MKHILFSLFASMIIALPVGLQAEESKTPGGGAAPVASPTPLAVLKNLVETDKRMPPKTIGGWKLDQAVIKDPSLPRVLLIGDSILVGYRQLVIKALEGKANVDVWTNPLHQGFPKTASIFKEVVSQSPYQVIHFNIGLHGIQPGRIPADQYTALTRTLIESIKEGAPQSRLIWASTTPALRISETTDELDPEMNPVVVDHNAKAAPIMAEFKIPTNDLYTLILPHLDLRLGRKDNYHWSPAAYELMTKPIVESIEREIAASKK